MKLLQLNTLADVYLKGFTASNPHLELASYSSAMEALLKDGFWACHHVTPYLNPDEFEGRLIVPNYQQAQHAWRREHGIRETVSPDELLRLQIEDFDPDVLYITESVGYDSTFVRSLVKRPKLVMGWRAAPVFPETDWSEFDLMLSNHQPSLELALERGASAVDFYQPAMPRFIAEAVKDEIECTDVVFCGQWTAAHRVRNKKWLDLAKATISQPRSIELEYYLLPHDREELPAVVSMYNKGVRFGMEMQRALKRGRICLNGMIDMGQGMSANMRLFEIAGAGAFQLMEHHPDIKNFFEPDVEIATYRNIDEMLEKILFYLDHPEQRREIARRGQERCLSEHGMERRIKDFEALVKKHLSATRKAPPLDEAILIPAVIEAELTVKEPSPDRLKIEKLKADIVHLKKRVASREESLNEIKSTVSWKLLKNVCSIERRIRKMMNPPG